MTHSSPPPRFPTPKVIGIKHAHKIYTARSAVRVVAFNAAGKIAIVYAKRDNYYKLPGGGIDSPDEAHETAVVREMREETGGRIKLRSGVGCVATTEEYRGDLHQISYCYVADLLVEDSDDFLESPNLTEDEVADGLVHLWVSVAEAKRRMEEVEPTSELGRFIKERDGYLIREATR
ncbi:NUDIX hydrolase domain-like protein [Apodospora peruviana]|uniref:NUDIX hydrolase domain-like protein n=1 Tax=Apodospora peruviana TaxID=516989 RepID=A0AAE0HUK0_9PEZI|nr:NUDIX hydrolase domain-like protein [Apodospora peruviana]